MLVAERFVSQVKHDVRSYKRNSLSNPCKKTRWIFRNFMKKYLVRFLKSLKLLLI